MSEKAKERMAIVLVVVFGLGGVVLSFNITDYVHERFLHGEVENQHTMEWATDLNLCREDDSEVCQFSCEPDGLCVFIPKEKDQ